MLWCLRRRSAGRADGSETVLCVGIERVGRSGRGAGVRPMPPLGLCATNGSNAQATVVGFEFGSNERLGLQASTSPDPMQSYGALESGRSMPWLTCTGVRSAKTNRGPKSAEGIILINVHVERLAEQLLHVGTDALLPQLNQWAPRCVDRCKFGPCVEKCSVQAPHRSSRKKNIS